MTVPAPFILRSYGGGAEAAQLIEPMGTTDTSFGITTTVGWTEADGSPLGTVGPFTAIIDRATDTVEKITCSSVNLTTGIVTVDTTGGSGRGADGTTPQAHVPGGSTSGVQTCWTSVEAAEANKAVTYVLGSAGGTPTTGEVLIWGASAPTWGSLGLLSANPTARIHFASAQSLPSNVDTKLNSSTTDFTAGGMTVTSDTIVVPVTGKYRVSGGIAWPANSNFGFYGGGYAKNGTSIIGIGIPLTPATVVNQSYADEISLVATDALSVYGFQDIGGPALNAAGAWLAVSLSSQ